MDFDDLVTKKEIELGDNDLRDDGLGVLIKVVQKSGVLEELHLTFNQLTLTDRKMAEAIACSRTLRVLSLQNNQIADEGAKRLADAIKANETLQEIHLYGNKIGDEGAKSFAEALAENKSLRVLSLGSNKIGDEGAQSLAASFETNKTLQCGLADAIKANDTLQEIDLWNNKIGADGAKSFADALAVNKSIRVIGLAQNKIGDEGARSLAASLETNQSLRCVYLEGNNITDEGALRLAGALKENYTIGVLDVSSHRAEKEINAILDDKSRRRVRELIESKDAENAALKQSLAAKDRELEYKEEEIASLNSLKESIKAPLEQLNMIVNTVDLTAGDTGPSNKRPRTAGGS